MTKKHKMFADEYLIDLNATRAYMAVYKNCKSENSAAVNASKLLRNPKIKAYIDEQLKKMHNEKIADATEVMEYLTSVVRGKSMSEIVVVEGVGEGCSIARTMQKQPDEKERLKAAELLGKRYSLFKDNVNVEGVAKVVIEGEGDLSE